MILFYILCYHLFKSQHILIKFLFVYNFTKLNQFKIIKYYLIRLRKIFRYNKCKRIKIINIIIFYSIINNKNLKYINILFRILNDDL